MSKFNKIPFNLTKSTYNNMSENGVFTKREWSQNNEIKFKNAEHQQKIAEKIIGECERIKEETEERTITNKETTEHRILERIEDVEFITRELLVQRKEICLELEALDVYKVRLLDCISFNKENCMKQCEECIMLRKNRIGIDLVVDEVEVALHKEMAIILEWQRCLEKAVAHANEIMRRIKAAQYAIDLDLEHKEYTALIDRDGANLKPCHLSLVVSKIRNFCNLDVANVTKAEWERFSAKNIANAVREVSSARPVRVTIDTFLQKVVEELEDAHLKTNRAFQIRIMETKKTKEKLENILAETIRKEEAMKNTIISLEKALNDKMPYLALVNTRLEKRSTRPGMELVKDGVTQSLNIEFEMLRTSAEQIKRALAEARTSLRYLMQIHAQLEEEINIKINSIKIDEVECMTIRESMNYHVF